MGTLKILSYNVRGLNSPLKRGNILREIKHLKADIVLIQETHISQESNLKISSPEYPLWYYGDSPTKLAKGVAIGFAKEVRFVLVERKVDPEGRYLLLRGKINEVDYSIANIYCPNKNSMRFLKGVIEMFMDFRMGPVVVAGDMNLCLDPDVDCTSRVQRTGDAQKKSLKKNYINFN